ncbi:MAG: helix-turn-helix transcriptional regulator, partial [Gordonibacter urolithinfaciens]
MIGSNIQSRRKMTGLTQEQLAERLGVARQTVAKWEAGDSVPDLAHAGALVEALDVSLDALVGFDPQGTM